MGQIDEKRIKLIQDFKTIPYEDELDTLSRLIQLLRYRKEFCKQWKGKEISEDDMSNIIVSFLSKVNDDIKLLMKL